MILGSSVFKKHLNQSVTYLRKFLKEKPRAVVFLGTGLGSLVPLMKKKTLIPYSQIPCFPKPSAFAQSNLVAIGQIGKRTVISFEGRFHAYEGHSFQEIGFPVRVAHALGAKILIATNIAGGINLSYKCGNFVLVEDHINLMGNNPLVGSHESWMGEKFLDLSEPYDEKLLKMASEILKRQGISTKRGVYAAVLGPHLETKAEYRYLKTIGTDLVGMSTVPEVLVARQQGMKVLVLSVVSDECNPDELKPISIPKVLEVARRSQKPLLEFLKKFITWINI